jgi:hypothetical protein
MKKTLTKLAIALSVAPTGVFALSIGAGNCPDSLGDAAATACQEKEGLIGMISSISNTILLVVGVIAVLMLIVGGFQYVMSAGNPEQVNKAKNTIFYAIIGIVVTLIAYVAVGFVLDQLVNNS